MTVAEQVQQITAQLPPEKQIEVLDFVSSLQNKTVFLSVVSHRTLKDHAAFGSWKQRQIDAVNYQRSLRSD
ncbi:MAG: DUF2281 domain-containing protein [Magnetococcales bacterium]|nr:DUF2281 domain-containing protein [Magnetococcales bacterium]